jgi:outer membrane protein assembly factor BamB
MKNRFLVIILLVVLLMSCGIFPKDQTIKDEDFPLRERWSVLLNGFGISRLAVSEDWIVASQSNGVTAIDTKTGNLLWNREFQVDIDSQLLFVNGNVAVASLDQMKVINKSGEELSTIRFDPGDDSAKIVAGYSDYVFVRRVPSWSLEVYQLSTGQLAWEIPFGRGNISVSFDDKTNMVYLTSVDSISAYDISDGNLIWKIDKNAATGVLEANVLFYSSEITKNKKMLQVSAVDLQSLRVIWEAEILYGVRTAIYNLASFDSMVLVGTNFGLLALDKKDGHELWQSQTDDSFDGEPVVINDVIYERSAGEYTIYAISPTNGQYLGYLRLGKSLLPISHSGDSIIYATGELLIFPDKNTVYAYEPR